MTPIIPVILYDGLGMQSGSYLGEDDIVPLEDTSGRQEWHRA
jgi:hypothetical protein